MKIKGIFYLKSGNIIEEEINTDDFEDLDDLYKINKFLDKINFNLKDSFKNNIDFEFSFGNVIMRGSDLSAVNFIELD